MKNIAKRSAASRKGARVRKRMKEARNTYIDNNGQVKKEPTAMMGGFGWQPPKSSQHDKPTYMNRALPNPWVQ